MQSTVTFAVPVPLTRPYWKFWLYTASWKLSFRERAAPRNFEKGLLLQWRQKQIIMLRDDLVIRLPSRPLPWPASASNIPYMPSSFHIRALVMSASQRAGFHLHPFSCMLKWLTFFASFLTTNSLNTAGIAIGFHYTEKDAAEVCDVETTYLHAAGAVCDAEVTTSWCLYWRSESLLWSTFL